MPTQLEEMHGMESPLEPQDPTNTLTGLESPDLLGLRHSDKGTQILLLRSRRGAVFAILHLGFSQLQIHYWHLPSNQSCHGMADTSLPQPAGSVSAQAPERCHRSHSCLPCSSLSSPDSSPHPTGLRPRHCCLSRA